VNVPGPMTIPLDQVLPINPVAIGFIAGITICVLTLYFTPAIRSAYKLKMQIDHGASANLFSNGKSVQVAWLMPSLKGGFYWQPLFREFTKVFPKTVFFTGLWPGFLPGHAEAMDVRKIRGIRFINIKKSATGYNRTLCWIPPFFLWALLRTRPQVIFVVGFNLCTLYALALKPLMGWRVVLLWDGISPTISYSDAPVSLMARRVMGSSFDATMSNTRAGTVYLKDVIGIPSSKLFHQAFEVPEALALKSAPNQRLLWGSEPRLTFLYVGQLIPRKGINHLLYACSRLQKRGVDGFTLMIIGTGPADEELRAKAASLGLESQLQWVGPVNYGELGAYYESCDVFVFPTMEDTWGMVVLEAMVFGKPVLCSQYAGSSEMVEHGVNGYVFDPLDTGELAVYMEAFIRDQTLAKRFGVRSGRKMADHTPALTAKSLSELIERAMSHMPFNRVTSRDVDVSTITPTSLNKDASIDSDPP
jgi:glycosyltransferase involved in cell wall biosynthesis